MPDSDRRQRSLYWLLTWILLALQLARPFAFVAPPVLLLYQVVLIGSYAFFFLVPIWLITALLRRLWPALVTPAAVILAGLLQLVLYGDQLLWQLYGFHFNGFVWNILTTPGGIAALGSSASTTRDLLLLAAGFIVLQYIFHHLAGALARRRCSAPRLAWVLPLFLLVTTGERLSYAAAHFYGYAPVLENARRVPFYQPLTMRRMLQNQLGWERPQQLEVAAIKSNGSLHYPQAALQHAQPEQPLNIVWLVAESWRADMLDARIMPQVHAFATGAQQFNAHFSGGNGTRIGIFSQFYSLPANLWFPVLDARRGSPLIDVLQQQNYQIRLFTSARFSYPEFDQTVFVNVPPAQRVEDDEGPTWQRDRRNVERLLRFIDEREPGRPFMTFMFFESPHANYNFPAESVLEADYLDDFSYVSNRPEREIGGIYKRYINAVHHLDSQLGRILDHLARRELLADTVVIITGDHGEEFMEKGRWGHNSTFVDEQIRVPLILWIPGRTPHRETLRTSHVDLLPTILPLLGVSNPAADYGIGQNLFAATTDRLLVAGDWDELAFLSEEFKLVLPFSSGSFTSVKLSGADDRPLPDRRLMAKAMGQAQQALQHMRRFLAH